MFGKLLISSLLVVSLSACKKNVDNADRNAALGQEGVLSGITNASYSDQMDAIVAIGNKVYFTFDSYELSDKEKALLEELAVYMRENPGSRFLIEGHCDIRGEQAYNIALGQSRANVVMEYLVKHGVSKSRLTAISYGKERLEFTSMTEESHKKNRRAVVVAVRPE